MTYSEPCQIFKTMRYIENPGIVRTVYSGIFRTAILRDINAYSGIIESYSNIFRTLCNSHILTTLPYSKP